MKNLAVVVSFCVLTKLLSWVSALRSLLRGTSVSRSTLPCLLDIVDITVVSRLRLVLAPLRQNRFHRVLGVAFRLP